MADQSLATADAKLYRDHLRPAHGRLPGNGTVPLELSGRIEGPIVSTRPGEAGSLRQPRTAGRSA